MPALAFFASFCYECFLGIQLWFQNVFFDAVLLGTIFFVDELINFEFFPCYFFLVVDKLWKIYTTVEKIWVFLVLFPRLVDDKWWE